MKNNTTTYFEVRHGNGAMCDSKGSYSFQTEDEAVSLANSMKTDPRSVTRNPDRMTDENVDYWESQTYIVVRTIKIVDELQTI